MDFAPPTSPVEIHQARVAEVIVWGAKGHALVINEWLFHAGLRLLALFDNDSTLASPIDGVPLYHGPSSFRQWLTQRGSMRATGAIVAIGGTHGGARLQIQQKLVAWGLVPITVVHPTAFVARDAQLGEGCQVLAQGAVCARAVLGPSCIVNTGATVDHECEVGAGVHVAPGATVAGCVRIGDRAMIGAGAVVLPRVTIGRDAVVGAGAVVTRDIPAGSVAYGNPARVVSSAA